MNSIDTNNMNNIDMIAEALSAMEEVMAENKKLLSMISEIEEIEESKERNAIADVDASVYVNIRNITREQQICVSFQMELEESRDFSEFKAIITRPSWTFSTATFNCYPAKPGDNTIKFRNADDAKSFLKNLIMMLLPASADDRIECYMSVYDNTGIKGLLVGQPSYETSGDCIPGLMLDIGGMIFHSAHRHCFGN